MPSFRLSAALGAVVLAIVAYYYAGEKIPVRDGYGYDGRNYAEIVEVFPGWTGSYADSYRIQRVLPPVVVAVTMRALGIERTPAAIVAAFVTLNVIALIVSFLALLAITRTLRLDDVRTVGLFAACFVGYALVKFPSFYPILTDHAAAALGLVMTLFYLRGRTLLLALSTAVSAFTWPTLPLLGVLFLAFPYGTRLALPERLVRFMAIAVPALVGLGFLALAYEIYGARRFQHWVFDPGPSAPYVAVPIALLYVVTGTYWICRSFASEAHGRSWRTVPWRHALFAIALLASTRIVQGLVVTSQSPLTQHQFLLRVVAYATERPLIFVVAHVAFLGPAFLLVIAGFPALCRKAAEAGLALQIALGAFLVFTLFSESRSFTPWWAPICVFSVSAFDAWGDRRLVAALVFLQALSTQAWLRAGLFVPGEVGQFPAQWYFMNFGPWMGPAAYRFFAGVTVVVSVVLLLALYRRSGSQPARAEEGIDRAVVA